MQDALVLRAIVFAEVVSEGVRDVSSPEVIGSGQAGEVGEDRAPGLAQCVGDVGGPVEARVLRMVENVERLEPQLNIAASGFVKRDVLEDGEVLVVDRCV